MLPPVLNGACMQSLSMMRRSSMYSADPSSESSSNEYFPGVSIQNLAV